MPVTELTGFVEYPKGRKPSSVQLKSVPLLAGVHPTPAGTLTLLAGFRDALSYVAEMHQQATAREHVLAEVVVKVDVGNVRRDGRMTLEDIDNQRAIYLEKLNLEAVTFFRDQWIRASTRKRGAIQAGTPFIHGGFKTSRTDVLCKILIDEQRYQQLEIAYYRVEGEEVNKTLRLATLLSTRNVVSIECDDPSINVTLPKLVRDAGAEGELRQVG